jgi:HK97 family phage prohead protease
MANVYNYKAFDLSVKDLDTKQGIVTGYFASFNTVDSDGDVFVPGAFSKSIKENFNRIKHLLDHDTRKAVGKIQTLKEDEFGLYYESKIGQHSAGVDFMKMVEGGLITEHSVGFRIPKNKSEQKDGVTYLKEVQLFEGSSLQTWGANQNTPLIGVKSLFKDAAIVEQRIKALEAFCRNTDATDEAIELLLIEVKQLTQLVADMQDEKTIEPEQSIQPEVKQHGIDFNRLAIRLLEK